MTEGARIRIARTEELEEILKMDFRLFGVSLGSMVDTSTWWLAEAELLGHWEPVGYAAAELTNNDTYAFLNRAGVMPVARGQGLQKRLIKVREKWARAHGATHAWTYVYYSNLASMRSLISCGYLPYTTRTQNNCRFIYLKRKL